MQERGGKWNRLSPKVVVMVLLNLLAGGWVTLRFSTPYSLVGTWSDMVVDALCGVVVLGILMMGVHRVQTERARRLIRVSAVPGIVLAVFPLVLDLLLFVPPFTLDAMFYWSEVKAEGVIQESTTPDGDWTARVYFRPVGPYAPGSGRAYVKVVPRWLPFIEQDVYENRRSYADLEPEGYVTWLDNERLSVREAEQVFRLTWWGIQTEAVP